jgi:hypothetical protein
MTLPEIETIALHAIDRSRNIRQGTVLLLYAATITRECSAHLRAENNDALWALQMSSTRRTCCANPLKRPGEAGCESCPRFANCEWALSWEGRKLRDSISRELH